MSYLFYGGIFTSPTEVETVRAASYKFYKLDPVRKRNQLPRVMLMTRANVAGNLPGRMIGNKDELSLYLRRGREWIYSEDAMELLDPRTQAQRMGFRLTKSSVNGSRVFFCCCSSRIYATFVLFPYFPSDITRREKTKKSRKPVHKRFRSIFRLFNISQQTRKILHHPSFFVIFSR